jgi:parallel beta-helix repeat protein
MGNEAGIELKVRTGVTVRKCVVTNFKNGFNIEDSTLNNIVDNTVMNNRIDGFHIDRSLGNIFDENTALDNDDDGFDLNAATANFFRLNPVHGNKDTGINLDKLFGNFFVDNTSLGNGDREFHVSHGSRYNAFVSNTACNNSGRVDFEENSNLNFFQENFFCKLFGIRPGEEF